jgi:hypothetical protein
MRGNKNKVQSESELEKSLKVQHVVHKSNYAPS